MLPATWTQFLQEPGKYVLAYNHHFVAARTDEDGATYVNFSNRTHMWHRFFIGQTATGHAFEQFLPGSYLVACPAAFDLVCKVSTINQDPASSLTVDINDTMEYSGGKTLLTSAQDVVHFMQTAAWETESLHQPQPTRAMLLAGQPLANFIQLVEQEERALESDSDDGFWDIRPDWYDRWQRMRLRRTEEYTGGALPLEVLGSLPSYFFSYQYLQALATASKTMHAAVQNHDQWKDRVIPLNNAEFHDVPTLRAMSDMYSAARATIVNVRQLAMFITVPGNAYVEWSAIGVRPQPGSGPGSLMGGFHSSQPLMGGAAFDLSLPSKAIGVYIGVHEHHGTRRSYCRIDNLFKESCTFSFGLTGSPPQPHFKRNRPEILPNVPVRYRLRWNERIFSLSMNGEGVSTARLRDHVPDTAPCLSKLFIWIFTRHAELFRVNPAALLFLPDPTQRTVMSKRRWEKLLYRGRVIVDFLEQEMDYMLFMYLHAETSQCSSVGVLLQDLPHPLTCSPEEAQGWRRKALRIALRVHLTLAGQERDRSDAWQEQSGGSSQEGLEGSFFAAGWTDPLPQIVGRSLGMLSSSGPIFVMTSKPEQDSPDRVLPCTPLREANKVEMDARLSFQTEGHRYFCDGNPVTGLIHQFSEEFDADAALIKMKCGTRWPRPEYIRPDINRDALLLLLQRADCPETQGLAKLLQDSTPDASDLCADLLRAQNGLAEVWTEILSLVTMSDQEILDYWQTKRDCAAKAGTWMHILFEHMLNGFHVVPKSMSRELSMAVNFLKKYKHCVAYRTEWTVYAKEEDVAGSIDFVLQDPEDDGLILIDWKRSEKLASKYASPNCMKHPLGELQDAQGQHYRLQLNMYKWILENHYSVKVKEMVVFCAHPQFLPDGFTDIVPNMQDLVDAVMEKRRNDLSNEAAAGVDGSAAVDSQSALAMAVEFDVTTSQPAAEEAMPVVLFDAHEGTKKRRQTEAAQQTATLFRAHFHKAADASRAFMEGLPGVEPGSAPRTILQHTNQLFQYVRSLQAGWPDQMVRLAAAALTVYRTRYTDLFIRDHVALLWVMEGGHFLRSHGGVCYLYHEHGAFEALSGVPPESTFTRIKPFLLALEGIFRLLPSDTERTDGAVIGGIDACLREFNNIPEYINECMDSSVLSLHSGRSRGGRERQEADGQRPHGSGWPLAIAEMISKISGPMQKGLLEERSLLRLVVEWCDTPSEREAGCAFADCCILYDRGPNELCTFALPSPANNLYMRIPHPLRDPVLEGARSRLEKFYEQTFWCNSEFFQCCQAAIALAKRGENIDRCFIGESGGGAGQGLYSSHLAAVYRHNHAFIDPNLWHNEDELRKQLEQFSSACIITAQEKPESNRPFREDLYKKMVSADDLAARKPYGYVTRMLRVVGWKRIETNDLMTFKNISEANFNSIFRRSLVWIPLAVFVDADYLEKEYPDAHKDGIFPKDPTLRAFLESGPAIAASLQHQLGFELTQSRENCRRLIETYAQAGLTEQKIRKACGLPERAASEKPAALAQAEIAATSRAEEDDDLDSDLRKAVDSMVTVAMENRNPKMLISKFSLAWWTRYGAGKAAVSTDKAQNVWKELQDKRFIMEIKSLSGYSKEGGQFIPRIFVKEALVKLGDLVVPSEATSLTECLEAATFYEALCSAATREANVEVLSQAYNTFLLRLTKKKGKKSLEETIAIAAWSERQQKLRDEEDSAIALLEHLEGLAGLTVRSQSCNAAKRRRKKGPSTPTASSSAKDSRAAASHDATDRNPFHEMREISMQVSYETKLGQLLRTRKYACGFATQKVSSLWQKWVVPDTVDLDIENCCFVLMLQIMDRLSPTHPSWKSVRCTLEQCAKERNAIIAEQLKMCQKDGKSLMIKVFNGGTPPPSLVGNEFLFKLQKASLFCRWTAVTLLPEVYERCMQDQSREHPDASCLFYLWSAVEDIVLDAWTNFVLRQKPKHISLHFDGIRVSRAVVGDDVEGFCRVCTAHIQEITGYKVEIRPKSNPDLLQDLRLSSRSRTLRGLLPAPLQQDGNCIPAALHNLGFVAEVNAFLEDKESEETLYFSRRKHRTYAQVQKGTGVHMTPVILPLDTSSAEIEGKYVVHCSKQGRPHAIALDAGSNTEWVVADGNAEFILDRASFLKAVSSACDKRHIMLFKVTASLPPKDEHPKFTLNETERERFLDLQAAAGEDFIVELDMFPEDAEDERQHDEPVGQDDAESQEQEEDESVTTVGDILLQNLKKEVESLLKQQTQLRQGADGRVRCPLCPFRSWSWHNRCRVKKHVREYHSARKQYCASGTKQLKIVIALHDQDMLQGTTTTCAYLRRSAEVLRSTIVPSLSINNNDIDRYIRLVYTGNGPEYWNLKTTVDSPIRRVRNLYYDRSFAEAIYRYMLVNNAKVYGLANAFHVSVANDLSSLLPSHAKDWWPMIEDVFNSPQIRDLRQNLLQECIASEEFQCISIDATMRCCLPIMGQARIKSSAEERAEAAFTENLSLRRVFTVRGRTSAVLLMRAARSEDAETACRLLAEEFPASALQQVAFVAADNPSRKLYSELKRICPNLQGMSLDTVHLAMAWEYSTSRKRSKGSAALRRLLSKFAAVDTKCSARSLGRCYDGGFCQPLNAEEERLRRQLEDRTMKEGVAQRILDEIKLDEPFYTRVEWIRAIAALTNVYKDEVRKVSPGPNRRVWELLHSATAPERAEWYMNNVRIRHALSAQRLRLLPSGTTSNEALHYEINRCFKETQKLHQVSLQQKLEILQLGKLLSHNRALYHHTTKQVQHGEVLARATRQSIWSSQDWSIWCAELVDGSGPKMKAELPKEDARARQRAAVRDSVKRKPAASCRQSKATTRRTAFTLSRKDSLVRGGKKSRCG
ncbi:unnamed protein product [Symbiodinium sp. CCMP2592]|nr:unnamed protein product [Symbiodinium sp. CCMP2592]